MEFEYWKKTQDFRPSFQEGLIAWGDADIDDEDDSIAGFARPERFTAWAVPVMEIKAPPANVHACHWGLLVGRQEKISTPG
jgi:hypothetical protein